MLETIVTHPDNVELVQREINKALGKHRQTGFMWSPTIRAVPYMPKEEPTGRIVTPDGELIEREGFFWMPDPFTEHDESDLPWLLGLKIVREEMQPVIKMMKDLPNYSMPRFMFPSIEDRRAIISSVVF